MNGYRSIQHIPLHSAERAAFRKKRFIKKFLYTTSKFPVSIPLARFPKLFIKRPNYIPTCTFEVKSALDPALSKRFVAEPGKHIAAAFRERLDFGQSAYLKKVLGTIHFFCTSLRPSFRYAGMGAAFLYEKVKGARFSAESPATVFIYVPSGKPFLGVCSAFPKKRSPVLGILRGL